jgi:NitT/TauT family transport system permease protein
MPRDRNSAVGVQTTVAPAFPEYDDDAQIEQPLPWWQRVLNISFVRKSLILLVLAIAWELYAWRLDDPLVFPRLSEVVAALVKGFFHGPLLARTATTLETLCFGYACGLALAVVLTTIAISSRIGTDLLSTLTAMFNPLPAIALLPLALLWFGIGTESLVFVVAHSVLWAIALSTLTGFQTVSETTRMVGANCGLRGIAYVSKILIPAAFPSILTGLKTGWAFAWRTLIAAELVFGVTTRSGGLGWYIFENRTLLESANVFAGLLTVIIIGLFVENVIFRTVEERTVRRWGMQK